MNHSNETGTAPKAYLNYIVFDRDFNPIIEESGFIRITTASKEDGDNVPHDLLENSSLVIRQAGYVYIYLSNENATPVEVFFDDFEVEHVKSPIVQMDDYYPFGLTFNSYQRENLVDQNYRFNGIEREESLELAWYTAKYRTLDPSIGRWIQIDPKVEDFYSWTPYNNNENNPIINSDPNGDCPWCIGAIVGAVTDYSLQVATNLAQGKDLSDALTDVDGASILVSAGAGALSGGLSTLSKLKTASTLVKTVTEVAVDAGASAASQFVTDGKIDASSIVIDVVAAQTVGKKAGDLAEKSARNTPTGKILAKDADRAKRVAGENPWASRAEKAANAAKKADVTFKGES